MRILIAAPPKSGNSWIKCLLTNIYELDGLPGSQTPEVADLTEFAAWVARDGFPDNGIFHQHYNYSPELAAAVAAVPAHLVTIIRDPYDAIVSLYFFIQAQATPDGKRAPAKREHPIAGKAIDDPATLKFLHRRFGGMLDKATEWIESGQSVVVRYEELHRDPMAELTRATNQIAPVDPERIARAITACQAQTLVQAKPGLRTRIRTATVGDWRNHLTEEHLERFRQHYAEKILALGYEVH